MNDAIASRVAARGEAMRRDILRLLAVPSVSDDRPGARRALREFLSIAGEYGLKTSLWASGDLGVAEYEAGLPDDAEALGILAHVDVVDPGEPSAWSRNPWGQIADGAVWGRGALDDKGPLVMCLHALLAAIEAGTEFKRRVRFVVGTMEEIDWRDIRAWLDEPGARPPDFGFTPDGEFPVTSREKGYCDAWLRFEPRTAHGSPFQLGPYRIEELAAGVSINTVPDSARAVISGKDSTGAAEAALSRLAPAARAEVSVSACGAGRTLVSARGLAAHSSTPELGRNALTALCRALRQIGPNPLVDFVVDGLGERGDAFRSGLGEGAFAPDDDRPGPTSASPDIARFEDGGIALGVNLRTAWGLTLESLDARFSAAASLYGFEHRLEQFMPAIMVPRDKPFLRALVEAYESRTGEKGAYLMAPGTSYAKALQNHVAFGPILPGMEDLCHRADERISFGDIDICAGIWAEAIAAIASL